MPLIFAVPSYIISLWVVSETQQRSNITFFIEQRV